MFNIIIMFVYLSHLKTKVLDSGAEEGNGYILMMFICLIRTQVLDSGAEDGNGYMDTLLERLVGMMREYATGEREEKEDGGGEERKVAFGAAPGEISEPVNLHWVMLYFYVFSSFFS